MTTKRDLKSIIRERQRKTGESYTAARVHVMRERAQLLGILAEPDTTEPPALVEAAVLRVGLRSTARIRILGEDEQITLRSRDVFALVPGHVATLRIDKRWNHRGNAYASGRVEGTRIDVGKLGLEPLPLAGGDLVDLRDDYEPFRHPDPYAPLWRTLTAEPRPWYEMDAIAWGAFPGDDLDDNPTCEAAELAAAGDLDGARELLMDALLRDLRCLDAHAHLGNLVFERAPVRALVHYEIGVRVGELSLPVGFMGVLPWSGLYNRPFLRCLQGYGLCLWRLGRTEEAIQVFERILALNPNDNQCARFFWYDARQGTTWEQAQEEERADQAC
jgi:hypothetical protein